MNVTTPTPPRQPGGNGGAWIAVVIVLIAIVIGAWFWGGWGYRSNTAANTHNAPATTTGAAPKATPSPIPPTGGTTNPAPSTTGH